MDLEFSHVDIIVADLDEAVRYHEKVLGYRPSARQVWKRGDFHVEFIVMFDGEERIFFVQPYSGNLKDLMDEKGEGIIYRYCFTTKDIKVCHRELVAAGARPEDENGNPIGEDDLDTPVGVQAIWLPKAFGGLSMEILEEENMERHMAELRSGIS